MKRYILRTIHARNKDMYTYKYTDPRGKLVKQAIVNQALEGLYIPPALDRVKINLNKRDKVLAIGYDTKDRAQYTYNKNYTKRQSVQKFHHMIQFGESYQKILKKIQQDLYTIDDSKDKQIAMILRFVIECSIRVGNEKYTIDNQSYGATTLESRHVKTQGPKIIVDFIGKKGVRNKCTIRNKKLSKEIRTQKRTRNHSEKLFTYRKGNQYFQVRPSDVNRYLRRFGNFTTKNFRTWGANIELIYQLQESHKISDVINSSDKEKKQILNSAIDKVADKLHNTRSVCKSNYLDPKLMDACLYDTERLFLIFKGCNTKEDYTNAFIKFLKTS